METLTKKPKYEWYNKLSTRDRQHVVQLYLQGYGLYRIGVTFGVTPSTIEYHLKKADVFTPGRKPTLFGSNSPIEVKKPIFVERTLTHWCIDDETHYYDNVGARYQRPKDYKQILRQSVKNHKNNTPIKNEQPVSQSFLVKVSLSHNVCVSKIGNSLHISTLHQSSLSNSLISW